MEEGALRVDANVSLRHPGEPLSTRTEIKNIGSIRGVAGAVRHEIERQKAVLESGGRIINETRSWDSVAKVTVPMRDKEVVQDYRYMPEPNLPPLRVNLSTKDDSQDVISVPLIEEQIPELPEETRRKLIQNYQIRPEAAIQLVNEPILLDFFGQLVAEKQRNPTKVSNLLLNELLMVLNKHKIDPIDCTITLNQLKDTLDMLIENKINLDVCKDIFEELIEVNDGRSAVEVVKVKGWALVSDEAEIVRLCNEIIENNPKLVKQYREGKLKVLKALLGVLSKNSHNKVNMAIASRVMEEVLKK